MHMKKTSSNVLWPNILGNDIIDQETEWGFNEENSEWGFNEEDSEWGFNEEDNEWGLEDNEWLIRDL